VAVKNYATIKLLYATAQLQTGLTRAILIRLKTFQLSAFYAIYINKSILFLRKLHLNNIN